MMFITVILKALWSEDQERCFKKPQDTSMYFHSRIIRCFLRLGGLITEHERITVISVFFFKW